jgi:hypothetical protein
MDAASAKTEIVIASGAKQSTGATMDCCAALAMTGVVQVSNTTR